MTGFWASHGWAFLLGCAVFPRITLLFFSSVSFGLWTILGWLFAPHLLVAILATTLYWPTDPLLVVVAWCLAFGGTTAESKMASGK